MKQFGRARRAFGTKGQERRAEAREEVSETGTIWYQGLPFTCTLVNVSPGGAQVEAAFSPTSGADIVLEIPDRGRFESEVVHVADGLVGMRFKPR